MFPSRVPLLALAMTLACHAQQALPQSFEVATIKPNADNDNRVMMRVQPGGRLTASGLTTKQLIGQAFDMRDFQIIGGPGWISTQRFDINAKAEGLPDRLAPGMLRPLMRNLLLDRFKLKSHTEEKEMPVYELVVGKGGPKLTPNTDGAPGPMIRLGRGGLDGKKMRISMLVQQLAQHLGRTVIDKTGLTGEYDITLQWTPEAGEGAGGPFGGPPPPDAIAAADSSGPTLFTAVQEQLGLRLESAKGPVPILVIDSIEKPTEN